MKCPECGNKLVKIIYGLPSTEIIEKVEKKEVKLGGCEVIYGIEQCDLYCYTCDKEFINKVIKSNKEELDIN